MTEFYTDGVDHSKKQPNSELHPEHQDCVNCGGDSVTITDIKDICHECGYVYT